MRSLRFTDFAGKLIGANSKEPILFTFRSKKPVMNNDDESFLSAYMDGQLAPDQQQGVESALVSNPQLAEKLRGFTLLRDMVAGLPRDGSVDISAQVMRQIRERHGRSRLVRTLAGLRHGSRRILPLAGLAATAASLMVAASLAILIQTSSFDRGGGPVGPRSDGETTVAQSSPPSNAVQVQVNAEPGAPETASSLSHTEISGALARGIATASTLKSTPSEAVAGPTEASSARDLDHVRQFLDDPNLKRLFLVRNGPKGNSEQQVASIVERTTRSDFFKITVSQGIVIDPRYPDEATVFAFVVNPNQLDRFHQQLKVALPGLVEVEPVNPVIATQLVDIGKVQACPPASLAEVEIPREDLALRTKVTGANEKLHGEETEGLPSSDQVAVVRPPVRPDNRVVVLVWIARPASE